MLIDPTDAKNNDKRLMHKAGRPTHQFAFPSFALKAEPDLKSSTMTELLYGEGVYVISDSIQWAEIVCMTDAYYGWVPKESLAQGWIAPTHIISTPLTHVYPEPNMKSVAATSLSLGSLITLSQAASQNGYRYIEGGGWIYERHITQIKKAQADPVIVAESLLHAPYFWGGRTSQGLDCSALVQLSLAQAGMEVHRDSDLQWTSIGADVSEPKRGDLAFFPGHVGFMVDSNNLIHANATNMKVTIDPLTDVIEWVRSEGKSEPFLGFKRL